MSKPIRVIPIYTTSGDLSAYLVYPMIYNQTGEWIGFVTVERDVYSVHGEYVGWVSNDPRILCKRSHSEDKQKLTPPPPPEDLPVPSRHPLAPMMSELNFETVDVLQDEPEKLPTVDAGELREDLN